jgi:hypothetical protein
LLFVLNEPALMTAQVNHASTIAVVPAVSTSRVGYAWLAWTIAALAMLALSIVTVRHLRETSASGDVIQFTIPPPENASFATPPGGGTGVATQVAVSPDGRNVVFVARSQIASTQNRYQLWLRPLGAVAAHAIPGTENGTFPFWSPDSRYIGFFANGKLKTASVTGGPLKELCDAPAGRGGTWNRDDVIVFAPSNVGVLQRVSATGGFLRWPPLSTRHTARRATGFRPFCLTDTTSSTAPP